MSIRAIAIVLACTGTAGNVARAQSTSTATQPQSHTPVGARDLTQPANVGLGPAFGTTKDEASTSAEVLLEGSTDKKSGTASITRNAGSSQFRLTLTAPVDQSTDEAVPLTLDGAGNGTTAELSYSHLSWGAGPTEREQAAYEALCMRVFRRATCKSSELTGADQERAEDLLHLRDAVWFWALKGSFGRNKFKYLDDSLHSQSVYRNDWEGKGYVGRYLGIGFLVASYSYGRGFSPGGPSREICSPLGDGGALRCQDAVLGAPAKDSHSVATLELRRFLGRGLAVAPLIQRDFENDVTALLLPVYFIKNAEGALMGGARAGWRSDDKAFMLAVFIGSAMTLTP
jgi:hypothetical protein